MSAPEDSHMPELVTPSNEDFSLAGRTAIVTGGAKGIGRGIADGLARAGARLVIADLAGAQEAATRYPDGIGVTADVSDPGDVDAMVDAALEATGRIDILVNNAGIYTSLSMQPFEEISVEEWRQVYEVNVIGTFLATRAVVPHMRRQGGGRIVNITSGTIFRGVPFLLHYVASKGAVLAMTKALAREIGGDGVLVNSVAPSFTISDGVRENPAGVDFETISRASIANRTLKRDQYPEDLAAAAVFLCSPGSAFMTGQTIIVDGGQHFQ
ncbi:MAG: SDR family NAD(P)-dependent oxidoreductase [bacterium]|nr:SDR family NAD(P)-dependent oxidoreductase [bacterium]